MNFHKTFDCTDGIKIIGIMYVIFLPRKLITLAQKHIRMIKGKLTLNKN